ncbi:MAG: DPP IV N-terminal domain-containing protein, partial [Flavobacteriales bacterium]
MTSIRWSLLAVLITFSAVGQNVLTLEDAVLRARSTYNPEDLPMMKWVPGQDAYSYLKDGYQTLAIEQVDGLGLYPAISTSDINEALAVHKTKVGGAYVLNWLDSETLYFQSGGKLFTYELDGTLALHQELAEGASNITIAPNSLNAAYTVDNNVVVSWKDGTVNEQVTTFEDRNIVSGQAIARSEFGITNGLFWSPDGAAIAFYQKDESLVANYPLLELTTTPGSLREIKYPMAGLSSEYARVGVFHRGMTSPVYLDTDGVETDQYLTNLSWSLDGTIITLAIINRAQNHVDLVAFNAQTGAKIGVLFSEDDEQWAEPEFPAYWVSDDQFIWMSERDGFM